MAFGALQLTLEMQSTNYNALTIVSGLNTMHVCSSLIE